MLTSLQLLSATASPSHCFQSDALQRETLSIVYQHCPADLQLLVKTKSYSLQHSEQHNKNYKEDWSSPQFKGKCTKIIWHLLQASLQQKRHQRIIEWLVLKGTLKIMLFQLMLPFTTLGCLADHSTWPWTSSGMRHSQFLCAICSSLWANKLFPPSNLKMISFSLKSLSLFLSLSSHIKSPLPPF